MYNLLRPLLFRLDPEHAHTFTLFLLRAAQSVPPVLWILSLAYAEQRRPVTAFGLTFENPVGLAAGYDKDGLAALGLAALGFGHIEIGTVTPLPQPGNPRPRVFRLVEDKAVVNRMGFPSRGAASVVRRLSSIRRPYPTILGVNLGKNKETPNEEAVLDYLALLQNFAPLADYLTINISSPNTVGLRQLQGREALESLLTQLHAQRQLEERRLEKRLPLLVKLAPDLTEKELDDAVEVILRTHMDGLIVTNTTLSREGLKSAYQSETGGLSGSPLRVQSEAVLRQAVKHAEGRLPLISVGGIMSPEDAKRRLDLGAMLIQLYTGLIYRGPGLVKAIVKSL
jgi:dihydroorotate dehydrogenase